MATFEDYYEILQVSPSAEPEVIEAAYKKLAQKYHPDVNKSPTAAGKMKKINIAHDVLGDPVKRKEYHSKWLQYKGSGAKSATSVDDNPPKPEVRPSRIRFTDMEPGKTKRTSFKIDNAGGPYTKIWFSKPDSWVRVVDYHSTTASDELPLEVVIEAKGLDWGESATERIRVKLDEEETVVTVELETKTKPKEQPKPQPKRATVPPKPSRKRHKVAAPIIASLAIAVVVLAIGLIISRNHKEKIAIMSAESLVRAELYVIDADGNNLVMLSRTEDNAGT